MNPTTRFLVLPLILAASLQGMAAPAHAAPAGVAPAASQAITARPKVGILVFDGVQPIDFMGPYEVFGQAGFEVFTIAPRKKEVTTSLNQAITARYTFEDAPKPDILVLPGGPTAPAQRDPATLDWIRARQADARHVLTVCTGALIAANAGLLDGKEVTTFHQALDVLRVAAPKAKVVEDRRVVDQGKLVTTAGLSSGLDGALHVVSKELGVTMARQVALNLEYDWKPGEGFARARLADMNIVRGLKPENVLRLWFQNALRVDETGGDERAWRSVYRFFRQGRAAAVQTWLEGELKSAGWRQIAAERAGSRDSWTFQDHKGRPWRGLTSVADAGDAVKVDIRVELVK